jgi:amidase
MNDLVFRTARDLARIIQGREASAVEVLESHLRQITTYNPPLNAIVTLDEEGARRRAREADESLAKGEIRGPLHGVPITIKDCFETAGMKTTGGFPPLKKNIPTEDATVVARLRDAGAVIMGKTNLSLLATDYQTDNPVSGRTNNPWDPDRTCGGSSGGSGAAVAAGLSPLDMGSDIAGSVRVPSHFCGVYGFKPTEHRVAWTDRFGNAEVSSATRATLEKVAATLERNGARVERIEPKLDYEDIWRTLGEIIAAELGKPMPFLLRNMFYLQFLLSPRSPAVKGFLRGLRLSGRGYAQALAYRDEVVRIIDEVFERFDAWLCPVTATPAFTHRKPGKAIEVDDRKLPYWVAIGAYTMPFNLSGNPVVVLPAGRSEEGLPIGVQVVGKRWMDEQLLAVASSLDSIIGEFQHPTCYETTAQEGESELSI